MEWLYVGVFVIGLLSSRVTLVGMRGGMQSSNLFLAVLGGVATIFLFSLFVWGFVALAWFWPLIGFAAGTVVSGLAVTRANFPFWHTISPFLDTATVVGGTYLWFWNWPF